MPIPMSPIDNIPTVARGAMLRFEFEDGELGYAAWKSNCRREIWMLVGELIGEVSKHVLAKIRGSTKTAPPAALRMEYHNKGMKQTADESVCLLILSNSEASVCGYLYQLTPRHA